MMAARHQATGQLASWQAGQQNRFQMLADSQLASLPAAQRSESCPA
jgi:hypothetical protein